MEEWQVINLLLCCYGFLKEVRPSGPYLTEYLLTNSSGLTKEELYQDVYPVWNYSYLAVLVLVFLFTDLARYKPVILLEGFTLILTWMLLLWGHGVAQMQFMQFVYGLSSSAEIAYFSYIYAKISGKYYRQVTIYTRTSLLMGRFIKGFLAQVLISSNVMDYRGLNYISLAMVSTATLISFGLPSVQSAVYFHRQDEPTPPPESNLPTDTNVLLQTPLTFARKWQNAFRLIYRDFLVSFSDWSILKYCVWYSLAMSGYFSVGNYIQALWKEILPGTEGKQDILYNGAVVGVTTLTGALLTLALRLPAVVNINWTYLGEFFMAAISLADGVMLYFMARTDNIWVAYIGWIIFFSLYKMMITVASFEIGSKISQDSYGLVFGFNTFLALVFQSMLTFVVAGRGGLELSPRNQFLVYSGYFLCVSCIFLVTSVWSLARGGCYRMCREGLWLGEDRVRETPERAVETLVSTGKETQKEEEV